MLFHCVLRVCCVSPQTDVLNVPSVDDSGLLMFRPVGGTGVVGFVFSCTFK